MSSQIAKALSGGFTPKQVLDFLMKKFPKDSGKIQEALAAGFTIEQILNRLSGSNVTQQKSRINTEHAQTLGRDIERRESINRGFGNAAVAAAGSLAAPMAVSALQRALPGTLSALIPSLAQQGIQPPAPPTQPGAQLSPLEQAAPSLVPEVQEAISAIPSEEKKAPIPAPSIDKVRDVPNFLSKMEELASSNQNSPEAIGAYFRNFNKNLVKEVEKKTGKPLEAVVEEYLASRPENIPESTENDHLSPAVEDQKKIQGPSTEDNALETPNFEKSSTVISPEGLGTIREIRNGKALIDVDGKTHQVDESKLIESPLPEKDLADLYDEVISGIEKQTGSQVSRSVNWAGYDPKTNQLAYRPHNGRLYVYDDISPEDAASLTNLLTQRTSTKENFIGAWAEGTKSPIGAALYQLIHKLQKERGGKGKEYSGRFDTIYDALEPAALASKERNAERKKKKS